MFNPMSAVTSQLPSAPEPEDPEDREKAIEQEKLRKEAIREAEEKRRVKHKKLEEEREGVRQNIRDKYNIEKKVDSDEEDEDEDEDGFGPKKSSCRRGRSSGTGPAEGSGGQRTGGKGAECSQGQMQGPIIPYYTSQRNSFLLSIRAS